MTSRSSVGPPLVAGSPSERYDPQNEAAFRREVTSALYRMAQGDGLPQLESLDLTYDWSDGRLYAKVVAGRGTRSVGIQISELADFSSTLVDVTQPLGVGETHTESSAVLTPAQRDQQWYARATPYSEPGGLGAEGPTLEDSVYAGRSFGYVREVPTEERGPPPIGRLTLIPIDGAAFDQIQASTQSGNGSWTAWAQLTADGSGNYVETVALHEKHPSKIAYRVYADSKIVQENVVTFDLDSKATVLSLQVSTDGAGTATVTALFDSDTATGANQAEYSDDSGATWTGFTVASNRSGSFTYAQSTSVEIELLVRAYNSSGEAGDSKPVKIPVYVPGGTETPRITSVEWDEVASNAGDCTATPVEYADNQIEWTVFGDTTGYTITIWLYDGDGSRSGIATGVSPTAGSYDDEITGYAEDLGGTWTEFTYKLLLVRTSDSAVVDSQFSETFRRLLAACP